MQDPIPFVVTIFAREEVLSKYTAFRPSLESFHPMASPDALGPTQTQFLSCFIPSSSPVRLQVQRQTHIDVLAAGLPSPLQERTDIASSKTIASGVVYSASRESNSVVWSGTISVPDKVRTGGFTAKGIRVTVRSPTSFWSHGSGKRALMIFLSLSLACGPLQDALVLSLAHPSALRAEYGDFCQSIPVRLTTETYDCGSGVVTVSDWSG